MPTDRSAKHSTGTSSATLARPLLRVLGAGVSAALLVASGYYWLTFRNLDSGLSRLPGVKVGQRPQGGADPAVAGREQNLLIVGNDDRTNLSRKEQEDLHVGPGQGSKATDTMMIVHLPADGSRATLISLPRDSYVDIPDVGKGRLNSAFVSGYDSTTGSEKTKNAAGANRLLDTVDALTGIRPDHYVQIGLLGFYRIANALNGVPVDMCADVDDPKSGFHITKGRHVLNGKQSLQFVRQRYNFPDGQGDLDRVRRQQYFLTAAFREVASANILLRLQSLGDALKTSLFLDDSLNILDLAKQVQNLTANNIKSATIPTSFATIDGQDVLQVDPAKVKRFVTKELAPQTAATPTPATTSATSASSATNSTPASTAATPAPSPTASSIDRKCTY